MTSHHNRLIGNSDILPQLYSAYDKGSLHSSLLFSGPKGVGKFQMALSLAHFLLVNGENIDISSKMASGSHPDFKILKPAEDANIIAVDQVRAINDFLRFTAIESKNKVVIIDSLDDMNNNAANALLKILEEPPENSYFICIAYSIGKILPTIRSRCRIENFNKIPFEEFTGHFSSYSGNIDDLYRISSGSIGVAHSMIKNDIDTILELVRSITGGNRSYQNLKQLAAHFTENAEKWEICYKALWLELQTKAKNNARNNQFDPRSADRVENLMKFIYNAKSSHLDVQQTIIGALS